MNHIRQGDAFIETPGKSRPGRLGQQPLPAGLVNNLEELRGCVLRRLESIEELARRCSDGPSIEITRTEQMLKQRIKELELERSRTCSDAALDQPVDKQLLTQLENDRQLLADAWERLERERIDALGAGASTRPTQPVQHPHPIEGQAAHGSPLPRFAAGTETANPVAESILRQFQTLCSDVRRATDARCSPH